MPEISKKRDMLSLIAAGSALRSSSVTGAASTPANISKHFHPTSPPSLELFTLDQPPPPVPPHKHKWQGVLQQSPPPITSHILPTQTPTRNAFYRSKKGRQGSLIFGHRARAQPTKKGAAKQDSLKVVIKLSKLGNRQKWMMHLSKATSSPMADCKPRMRLNQGAAGRMIAFQLNQNRQSGGAGGGGGPKKGGDEQRF